MSGGVTQIGPKTHSAVFSNIFINWLGIGHKVGCAAVCP